MFAEYDDQQLVNQQSKNNKLTLDPEIFNRNGLDDYQYEEGIILINI